MVVGLIKSDSKYYENEKANIIQYAMDNEIEIDDIFVVFDDFYQKINDLGIQTVILCDLSSYFGDMELFQILNEYRCRIISLP